MRRLLMALSLLGLVAAGCGDDDVADDPVVVPTASASAAPVSEPPPVAGPRKKTAFDYIREFGVRPGSADDLLIRDLLVVADSAQAHIAARGQMGTLDEIKATKSYSLRGGRVDLVSGAGTPAAFCLRAYLKDDDARVWFYDTDRVLPRGQSCA